MRSLRLELRIVALALLAVAVVWVGAVNLREQHRYQLPDDGVFWVQTSSGLAARDVAPDSPAARAGIQPGDVLLGINGLRVRNSADIARRNFELGVGAQAHYELLRNGSPADLDLILETAARPRAVHAVLQLVGLLYLVIGLFVLLRRFSARRATHFYLFCLASFVLFVFSYTGKLNNFDWFVYWSSAAALLLQPALFAHFCLAYPGASNASSAEPKVPSAANGRHTFALAAIYGPAALLGAFHVGLASGYLRFGVPLVELRWLLDRLEIGYLVAMFFAGIAILAAAYRRTASYLVRKQLNWVLAGSLLSVVPFAAVYGVPYFLGVTPGVWMNLSALSLAVLPITIAYAIVRYRLLDIEIVLERGAAYTLATAVLAGSYFGIAALIGDWFRSSFPGGGTLGLVIAVVATGVLFQPLERWIRARLERYLLPRRYDYRDALAEFGRELGAQSDLDGMIRSLLDQLSRTLRVEKAAVFLASGTDDAAAFELRGSVGLAAGDSARDFSFLNVFSGGNTARSGMNDCLFLQGSEKERERELERAGIDAPGWPSAIAQLGLHYYFACRSRNRVVAVLAVGKTREGEFLWDEDVALVRTLAGYLAIAVENAGLLTSLVSKATQFEKLQEFSQNILESINVGLLAVDLEDRVEAINTPLKMMAPIASPDGHRYNFSDDYEELRGRKLSEVLPPDLARELDRLRDDAGIHNLYRYRVKNGAGEERVLNIAVAPLLSKNCDWIGRLIIFDDVTDRVGLETQLAQSEKLSSIGLLAAGVAHEVNTPLTVISTQAQMLAKQLPPGDKRLTVMEKIIGQTFRASQIVNSLLNFSRTKGAAFVPLDANKLIAETLLLLDHQFKAARVEVLSDFDASLPAIFGNSDKLQQVFLNLFLNAKDAMLHGGRLTVSTRAENLHIEIKVSDTGVGIAPENIGRIYDPFFTTKGSGRGTGLGLAVSYGIIHEHSGSIHVESEPGSGTRFRLEFPAARKEVHA